MPLTLEQGDLAGKLAAAIAAANAAIADLDARIADIVERKVGVTSSSMALDDGTSIHAAMPLSYTEAAEILGHYRTLLATKRAGAQAAFDAIKIA